MRHKVVNFIVTLDVAEFVTRAESSCFRYTFSEFMLQDAF